MDENNDQKHMTAVAEMLQQEEYERAVDLAHELSQGQGRPNAESGSHALSTHGEVGSTSMAESHADDRPWPLKTLGSDEIPDRGKNTAQSDTEGTMEQDHALDSRPVAAHWSFEGLDRPLPSGQHTQNKDSHRSHPGSSLQNITRLAAPSMSQHVHDPVKPDLAMPLSHADEVRNGGEAVKDMVLHVKTLTGRTIDVHVELRSTMADIKDEIQRLEGIQPAQQRLIFDGKQVEDGNTVAQYNLKQHSVLHLMLRLRETPKTNLASAALRDMRANKTDSQPLYPAHMRADPDIASASSETKSEPDPGLAQQHEDFREKAYTILGRIAEMSGSVSYSRSHVDTIASSANGIHDDMHGYITYFRVEGSDVLRSTMKAKVSSITMSNSGLSQMRHHWSTSTTGESPSFQWIHLPANNMEWVTDAIFQIESFRRDDPHAASERQSALLHDKHWQDRQEVPFGKLLEDRYMKSYNNSIAGNAESSEKEKSWVLFMPYLHWERSATSSYVQSVVCDHSLSSVSEKKIEQLPCCADELCLRKYVRAAQPLHLRRPLYRYWYRGSVQTDQQDYAQVMCRYAREILGITDPQAPMLIVDQLWMWIIDGNTIVTAAPQRWQTAGTEETSTEVIDAILSRLDDQKLLNDIRNSHDLANIIVDCYSSNMLEAKPSTDVSVRCLDVFEETINRLISDRNGCSRQFFNDIRLRDVNRNDDFLDVAFEFGMMERIKHVQLELSMIRQVLGDQLIAWRRLENEPLRSASWHTKRSGWMSSDLSARAYRRSDNVRALETKASEAYNSILELLNAKQQYANVSEARSSRIAAQQMEVLAREAEKASKEDRRQGDAILLFTLVTIIFLPFSSLASVFGMNAVELGSGSLPLGTIFACIFPISAFIVFLALSIAFSPKLLRFFGLVCSLTIASLTACLPANIGEGVLDNLEARLVRMRDRRQRKTNNEKSVS